MSEAESRTGQVARSTLVVMGGFSLSIVTGIIRQRVVNTTFGTSAVLDAYTAANGIPELLFAALAGGALTFAFIPIYTGFLTDDDEQGSNALFSNVLNAVFLLTALASLIVALFAPVLVRADWGIGPGFDPETQVLTAQLMRILLLSTLIFAVSHMLTGSLYAHQHFLLPAITPVMYAGGIIAGVLILSPSIGIFGYAWGAVAGSVFHLLIQIPGLLKYRIRWRPILDFRNPAFIRVAVLMAPRVIDLLMARIAIDWLNNNRASWLGEGSASALQIAKSIMNMPWTMIGTAIGIAVFPTMAALAAKKDVNAQRNALSGALRAILTLALPAAVGMVLLGRPLIQILYEGGEFTSDSTQLVYYALQFYAVTLISQTMLEPVVRAFAAQEDTWTPLYVSFFTTALNVGLAIWLARPQLLAHGGLPLANGIAVGIEALTGLVILHIRWKGVDARRILIDAGKAALASLVMAGAILVFKKLIDPGALFLLVGGGLIGVAVYFGVALLLGIEEIRTIPMAMLKKAGR